VAGADIDVNPGAERDAAMKLYDCRPSANARRVRMFLAEKGVEVPLAPVDIVGGANLQPSYLAKNPRGLVPALELGDDLVLDEAPAICAFFETLHPEPVLMGEGALERALVLSWDRRCEFEGIMGAGLIFRNTDPAFAERAMPGPLGRTRQSARAPDLGRARLAAFYPLLEARLTESPYLAGDRLSLADITGLCAVQFAEAVGEGPGAAFPALRRWRDALAARPSAKA